VSSPLGPKQDFACVRIDRTTFSSCVAGLLIAAAACARASDSLELIEVVADDSPVTGSVEHSEFTGSHQRINRQQLQSRRAPLADVLASETGVQSRQSGGSGSFSSITVRAANSAQTGVYLDGILLNSGGNSVIDLSTLELLNLDSVDIYRGSTPLQLGHGAIGGAVNLNTLSAQLAEPQTRLLLGSGSFSTRRLQIAHQSGPGRWDVVSALSRQQSNNDFDFNNNNGTPLNPLDDQRETRHNADVVRLSGLLRTGYHWTQDSRTDLIAQISARDLGVPEWRNAEDNNASFDTESQQLQLSHSSHAWGRWNTRQSLFQHRQFDHFDDRLSHVGLGAQDTRSLSVTNGFKSYWENPGDQGTFGITAEFRREIFDAKDLLDAAQNHHASRNVLTATTQYAWFTWQDRLLATPSLRWQSVDDNYIGAAADTVPTRHDAVVSPQLGVGLELNKRLTLRGNIGHFYREPAFHELFGARGLVRGNTRLRPERGLNADAGITFKTNRAWKIDASVFASWRNELITTVYDSRGIGRSINAGKARVLGLELGNEWHFSKALSARLNMTVQDARSINKAESLDGKQLPGEARLTTYARLQYHINPWRIWFDTNSSHERYYDQANLLAAGDQWLQNAGLEWHGQRWLASATVNNLGNRNVEDFNGFPRPGRAFQFTLTLTL
jgi:iron complex outermembrane receptor protein